MSKRTQPACAEQVHYVKPSQLPISCPTDDMALWNAHPRVFIPLSADNPIQCCPYCGTKFELVDEAIRISGGAGG